MINIEVRKATIQDFDEIVNLFDGEFTPDGFGFVNKMQVKTEILRGAVWVAFDTKIIGVRIGKQTLFNIVVAKSHRGNGVGRKLVEARWPQKIRVKCDPIGHLSKAQKKAFKDPRPFYEALGFRLWGKAKAKNFWQNTNGKAVFHKEGEKAHIHVYVDPAEMLFMPDVVPVHPTMELKKIIHKTTGDSAK